MDWFDLAEDQLTRWKAREGAARDYRKSFTPVAQKALDVALAEARKHNFSAIGAEHLLLGLIQVPGGPVSKVFAGLGLSAEIIRSEAEKTRGGGPETWLPERSPFTPRMKSVLRTARLEAKAQGRNLIDAEHLLIGLVREKEGLPANLFRRLGIDAEVLGKRLLKESARI
jgi:ATP-dependent Clp protease ATP-binding subunit ClpC